MSPILKRLTGARGLPSLLILAGLLLMTAVQSTYLYAAHGHHPIVVGLVLAAITAVAALAVIGIAYQLGALDEYRRHEQALIDEEAEL